MNRKTKCKIGIDLAMTVVLLLLMARQITGFTAHEWLGAGMFMLWIAHHVLNRRWFGSLRRGRYTPHRVLQLAVNILLVPAMLGSMVSAVILSREVFAFLPVTGGAALARPLHILSVFWCFVLMALHLGLHWDMVLGMLRRAAGPVRSRAVRYALRAAGAAVAAYGLYAFVHNQIASYLFLTSPYVFFDFERPVALFFLDYLAIMGLFVFAAHVISAGLQRLTVKPNRTGPL